MRNSDADTAARMDLGDRLEERIRELPEVSDAALQTCRIPNCVWNTALHVEGHPELSDAQMHGEENHVSAGYFHTLGIPLLRGRVFEESDGRGSQPVVILNRSYAKQLFGTEDPVGRRLGYTASPGDRTFLVVGEVGDACVDGLRKAAPSVAYFSVKQGDVAAGTIEVRARGKAEAMAADIRSAIRAVDARLPVTEIVALQTEFEDGLSREMLLARLTSVFGALTLLLAAVGLYGLLSFQVTRRTAEIGIRMALGSSRAAVHALLLRQTLAILALGMTSGAVLTVGFGLLSRSLLYGSAWGGAGAVLPGAGLLFICAMLATLGPARRAARVDPLKALRSE
jgi:predicted permease